MWDLWPDPDGWGMKNVAVAIGWFLIDRLSLTAETWPMAINQGAALP